MWYKLGRFILKFRFPLLLLLLTVTAIMGYFASKVQLSYEFSRAIPTDNPKYIDYQQFRQRFGDDGNTMVLGIASGHFFSLDNYNAVSALAAQLKTIKGVQQVLSVPSAITLVRNDTTQKLQVHTIFQKNYSSQALLDSDRHTFENLPFYQGLLYNPSAKAYLLALQLDKNLVNSKARSGLVQAILKPVKNYEDRMQSQVHVSGLPFIRTTVADRIAKEMNWFLIGSFVLSAITLLLFFRSLSTTVMSLLVVGMGVVWSLATMVLFGYKITLLTALIPPLIVVIGIPNCIYFLNKYHTAYLQTGNKREALVTMVGRMGIVTLFCNIAAAIGFAVFAFTRSALLKEFGAVSGINILALFVISLFFIPIVLSYLPAPQVQHTRYLDNKFLEKVLLKIENWALYRSKWVYAVTAIVTIVSLAGILRLRSEGFIVDDLPKTDKIYTDLKWFEKNFNGVMPLEVVIDTKRKNGLFRNLQPLQKIDTFSQYMAARQETAKPLSFIEGLKFAKQAFYDGDSLNYTLPTEFDIPLMGSFIKSANKASDNKNSFTGMVSGFIDTSRRYARISINMKDIGSEKLPVFLNQVAERSAQLFDTAHYQVTFTGSSISFLEGSRFIINGLRESIIWAFVLIALCMLYLFKSVRILLCSLIPNIVPLMITAGVMGWAGITLKPSTVLIFSVALGIAIDVTIRFLINYKQELPFFKGSVRPTLVQTIRHTGISIIYTSLVLIAGFVIFCFSSFGGTKGLGWLTSLTLVTGTVTNLVLLPVLMMSLSSRKRQQSPAE